MVAFQRDDMVDEELPPVALPTPPEARPAPNTALGFIPQVTLAPDGLPSKGLPYPKGASIKYRAFSFGEIKKISQEKPDERDALEMVLSGVECSFDKYQLTVADAIYIGLLRKISSIPSNKITVGYQCPNPDCRSKERSVFELSHIEFNDIQAPELPVVVEIQGDDYEFRPVTVKQYFELVNAGKQKDTVAFLAKQCVNKPFDFMYDFMYKLAPVDGLVIDEVDKLLYHEMKPVPMQCTKCKRVNHIELDGGQALMMPFRELQESPKTRIRFGSKAKNQPH